MLFFHRTHDIRKLLTVENLFPALQNDLNQKSSEAKASKARIEELEQIMAKKDQAMTDQKRLLKKVKVRCESCLILEKFYLDK